MPAFASSLRASCALASLAFLAASCGSPAPAPSDAGSDAGPPPDPTFENVSMILSSSCAFASCHGGAGAGAAMLNFERSIAAGTLREDLVDQPACEYSAMPLVTAGDPTQSWLYLKAAGPHTGTDLDFTPDTSWDPGIVPDAMGRFPASTCPLTERGALSFGQLMPQGTTGLDGARAETLRLWIANGAPGPS